MVFLLGAPILSARRDVGLRSSPLFRSERDHLNGQPAFGREQIEVVHRGRLRDAEGARKLSRRYLPATAIAQARQYLLLNFIEPSRNH
jgi:glutamyl/glutaminyl-tRNA synthetase